MVSPEQIQAGSRVRVFDPRSVTFKLATTIRRYVYNGDILFGSGLIPPGESKAYYLWCVQSFVMDRIRRERSKGRYEK